MRPGENHALLVRDVLMPITNISAHWAFLIREAESGIPDKVGEYDKSVLWDVNQMLWVGRYLNNTIVMPIPSTIQNRSWFVSPTCH